MDIVKNGFILLGIWLVLTGLIATFQLTFQNIGIIMGILALISGILILMSQPWKA